jgi:hypothetical protein
LTPLSLSECEISKASNLSMKDWILRIEARKVFVYGLLHVSFEP